MIPNLTKNKFSRFSFLLQPNYIFGLLVAVAALIAIKQYNHGSYNNYSIFKYTFWHLIESKSLYAHYPDEYWDRNHYGPVFALFIAPFALLPDYLGMLLWNVCSVLVFAFGIKSLPLSNNVKAIIALICANELITALLSFQFNIFLTGAILIAFSYTLKNKNGIATFPIISCTMIKLYGIVGLAFFFFTQKKIQFILGLIFWAVVLFVVPMLLSSPKFIIETYVEWFNTLVYKNSSNISLDSYQDISFMGMVRRSLGDPTIPNTPFLIGGVLLFGATYLRIKQFQFLEFRLLLLASTLIFTVIFSSGSESPTYIIAFTGVAIWFMRKSQHSKWEIALLIFAILLTSLSPTDLFPKVARVFIRNHALKALPCIIIWFTIIYEMLTKDFKPKSITVCEN